MALHASDLYSQGFELLSAVVEGTGTEPGTALLVSEFTITVIDLGTPTSLIAEVVPSQYNGDLHPSCIYCKWCCFFIFMLNCSLVKESKPLRIILL